MAWEQPILDISYEAGEDLSGDQFHFVVLDATTKKIRRPDSATEKPEGILQDAPASGQKGRVRVEGYSKLVAGSGGLAMGSQVGLEYIGAADAGKGVPLPAGSHSSYGEVVASCDAEDEIATVHMFPGGRQRRESISVGLVGFTANTTVRQGILAVTRPIKVTAIYAGAYTKPADADGTCLLAMMNHDKSAGAEDALLAASKDLEGLVAAKDTEALALTATAADLLLDPGDYIYAELINNSAAIDTAMAAGVVTVEFEYRDA